jgi:hypothetical protein
MKRIAVLLLAIGVAACGGAPHDGSETAPPAAKASSDLDPDNPSILMRPFTADQIRDEMVEGLRVLLRRTSPDGEVVERWTVLEADGESVAIEYAELDGGSSVTGEPGVNRATWVELRDHATFPAGSASRERRVMETALGTHEGWFYTVESDEGDSVDEFFFADDYPGAPLLVVSSRGGSEVARMEQFARLRPENR